MKICPLFIFVFGLCFLTQASSATETSLFQQIIHTKSHYEAVLTAAKKSTTWIRHNCRDATFKPISQIKIWKQPAFNKSGQIINGVWGESFKAKGCGIERQLNTYTQVIGPNKMKTGILAPGATVADPLLQMDTSKYVFPTALTHFQNCKQAFIDDTQVIIPFDRRNPKKRYSEKWIISACGHLVPIHVNFIPDRTGTTIATKLMAE